MHRMLREMLDPTLAESKEVLLQRVKQEHPPPQRRVPFNSPEQSIQVLSPLMGQSPLYQWPDSPSDSQQDSPRNLQPEDWEHWPDFSPIPSHEQLGNAEDNNNRLSSSGSSSYNAPALSVSAMLR